MLLSRAYAVEIVAQHCDGFYCVSTAKPYSQGFTAWQWE